MKNIIIVSLILVLLPITISCYNDPAKDVIREDVTLKLPKESTGEIYRAKYNNNYYTVVKVDDREQVMFANKNLFEGWNRPAGVMAVKESLDEYVERGYILKLREKSDKVPDEVHITADGTVSVLLWQKPAES